MFTVEGNFGRKIQSLVDCIPEGVLLIDSAGEIIFSNRALSGLFRKETPEAGTSSAALFTALGGEFKEPSQFGLFILDKNEVARDTFIMLDGRSLEVSRCPLTWEEGDRLWMFRDVTQGIDASILLDRQRSQIVESAKLKALGEMAGGIAHEINNPLAIIQSYAGILRSRALKGVISADSVLDAAERINNVVVRISKIVKNLRSFAKDGEGESYQTVEVLGLVEDTLSFCRERIKNHGVELLVAPIAPALMVKCKPVSVSQVLLNLLTNAFDAVEESSVKWIRIDVETSERCVSISVTDSGGGVPEYLREKIFVPFFSTKETGKGTGLGLSLSRGIAESMGGSLVIDQEAANTRFVLSLPRNSLNENSCSG